MDDQIARFGQVFEGFMQAMTRAAHASALSPARDLIDRHLGLESERLPVVSETFTAYDHVNVQTAMSAYLAAAGRAYELIGFTGQQRHFGTLSDLIEAGRYGGAQIGSVDYVNLACSPHATLACVQFGLFLITAGDARFVVLMRGPGEHGPEPVITLEVVSSDSETALSFFAEIRDLMVELNVFRGQVVSFGESHMGHFGAGPLIFLDRPKMAREDLVLAPGVLESIETEVLGIARHRERLRASAQHVKRGLLLHGPPGVGKTHTVRYLLSRLGEHTVVLLTGGGLMMVRTACALARLLQPAVVVLEDVDLVALERGPWGPNPVLFDVLNEMDGLAEDADVAFLLTTNRADLLEPALAARPGRVDLAVEIALPDDDARGRLIRLYGRGLDLQVTDIDTVVARTAGVAASFIKELLRKGALIAAERGGAAPAEEAIVVTDADLAMALDELLLERSKLTRILLGGERGKPGGMSPAPWLELVAETQGDVTSVSRRIIMEPDQD